MPLERCERVRPELVEVAAERIEACRVDLVKPPIPIASIGNEARRLEHCQVLRDRRPADRELSGELAHRRRPLLQELVDNGAAHGFAERIELEFLVSVHLR